MAALARGDRGGRSLELRLAIEDIVRHVRPRDRLSLMAAIYNWLDRHYHFLPDPKRVEQVKDPLAFLTDVRRRRRVVGDCDDASTFLAGAGETIGMRVDLVRAGFRPSQMGADGAYTHVLAVAYDQYGRPVVLDPVAGPRVRRMLQRVRQVAVKKGRHVG